MPTQLAAQMYTLRDFLKTPADIAKTMAKVRKIGYEAVQLSALGPIDARELAKILKGEGLTVAATHVHPDRMRDHSREVIDDHALWGCKYMAIGGYFKENPTLSDWRDFIKGYNRIADLYANSTIRVGYHNHNHELAHYEGKPMLQILLDELKPSIWIEIDTYWVQAGGGDAAAWIDKLHGRIPCVHLKDMVVTPKREVQIAEVGEGNMNWPSILKACKAAGVEWYIVEQDVCQRDPFESLTISLKNLHAMGLK